MNLSVWSLGMELRALRCQFTSDQSCARLKRNALLITETELKLIAAAAIIGLSNSPVNGYRTPAAMGTPSTL